MPAGTKEYRKLRVYNGVKVLKAGQFPTHRKTGLNAGPGKHSCKTPSLFIHIHREPIRIEAVEARRSFYEGKTFK